MMVIEMREATKEKVFDLLDEIKDLGHKKKLALSELEDALYECFEEDDREDEESDMNYRKSRMYRSRRSSMRDHSDYEDDDYEEETPKRRHTMRIHR